MEKSNWNMNKKTYMDYKFWNGKKLIFQWQDTLGIQQTHEDDGNGLWENKGKYQCYEWSAGVDICVSRNAYFYYFSCGFYVYACFLPITPGHPISQLSFDPGL